MGVLEPLRVSQDYRVGDKRCQWKRKKIRELLRTGQALTDHTVLHTSYSEIHVYCCYSEEE